MTFPTKVYRWLLRLYPVGFRDEYETPMERQFRDDYREASTTGEKAQLWLRTLRDVLTSAPVQLAREVRTDLLYTMRAYRSRALASALSLLALTLAMGACTGVFSVVSALLLRELPFSQPEQLVEFRRPLATAMNGKAAFQEWRSSRPYLHDAATFAGSEVNLAYGHNALRVRMTETSADFFGVFGAQLAAGRAFLPSEDAPGQGDSAVISYGLSRRLFGHESSAVGKQIRLNGRLLTVIGVAASAFDYPRRTEVWTPTVFDVERMPKRGPIFYETVGRLKASVDLADAQRLYRTEVERVDPKLLLQDNLNRPQLISIRAQLAGPVADAIPLLAGTVILILTIACANVALLLLSRTSERRQELAVRAVMGASRGRLVQQLITESTTLTLAASALGLVVARWATTLALRMAPPNLAIQSYTVLDWRVLTFATLLAVASGILFGLIPVLFFRRMEAAASMRQTRQSTHDFAAGRMRSVLAGVQAALTLALLAGTITTCQTFIQLLNTDLGFSPTPVVTLTASLEGTQRRGRASEWRYYSDVLDRLRAMPGVEAAGAVSYLPLGSSGYMANSFKLDSGETVQRVLINAATSDYFRAMGTTFVAGRDFSRAEAEGTMRVVVVNAAFAERTGLHSAIVGRRVLSSWNKEAYTIVGVVNTTSIVGPAYPGAPQIYWPVAEEPPVALTFVARVRGGDAFDYAARCRDTIRSVDKGVPIFDVKTYRERLAAALAKPRFYATAMTFLGTLALFLATLATYGTASYAVAHRTREMGVRLALGASPLTVRKMLMIETLTPILAGLAAGAAVAVALEQMAGQAFPWAAAGACLWIAGLLASWKGTSRVLAIDPADTIRSE